MQLARVAGTLVATDKEPSLDGLSFRVLSQLDADNQETGSYVVAVDALGTGIGEVVMYASGSSARQTEMTEGRPCDAVIMAIVDTWEIGGEEKYRK
ncbi:MAG: EutN/CcmL family microcompartment protein [Acidimicrobiia bacterium]|nr:EutN/CcmL family microcompartment protein [Acidimicrobiia bacterium]